MVHYCRLQHDSKQFLRRIELCTDFTRTYLAIFVLQIRRTPKVRVQFYSSLPGPALTMLLRLFIGGCSSILLIGCSQGFLQTGQEADIVLGELGFNQSGGPLLFNHPKGIATDGTVLMMADGNNNRVLLWDELPTSNIEPSIVLGQQNFDTSNSGESDTELKWPADVAAGGGKYIIADTYNHRILVWNDIPDSNGATPDLILISGDQEDTPFAEPSVDRFAWPWGVWTDGNKLIVTSTSSGSANGDIRFGGWVLIWNTFPTSPTQPADIVLSANRQMGTPRSITTDGESFLIIGDHNAQNQSSSTGNWLWTTFPTDSSQLPDGFITEDRAMGWQAGDVNSNGDLMMIGNGINVWEGIPDAADFEPAFTIDGSEWELRGGDGSTIAVAADTVYISDYNTNRIVGFNQPPTGVDSIPDFVIGSPDLETNTLTDNHFISNGIPLSLKDGELLIGDGLNTRLLCWKSTPEKSGQPPDTVINFEDEVIAITQHDNVVVVGGKREGIKVWDNENPCNGQPASREYRNQIGSINTSNLQSVAHDSKNFYIIDGNGTLHIWDDIPEDGDAPEISIELGTFEGILYSDGKHLSISGMDAFKFIKVSKISADADFQELRFSERPQMIGHGIIKDGQLFLSDISQHQVLAWKSIETALEGDEPDAIIGATSLEDTDPDKTRSGLFWPLRLDFDGDQLWVGEYKFSGRVLSYPIVKQR